MFYTRLKINLGEKAVRKLFTNRKYLNSSEQMPAAALSTAVAAVSFPVALLRQMYEAWSTADCYCQVVSVVPGSGLGFHSLFLV